MEGRRLGPYRIESELGSGGMGKVYLAEAAEPCAVPEGTRVAIKVVHPHMLSEPGLHERFHREAEIGKAVAHPNVVRCHDADELRLDDEPVHFLVMEYVEGQTLRDLLRELEQIPEVLCRHIAKEVSKGLSAIHEVGAVHRDLKPENVLITPDHVVKIMDLGVARLADEAIRLSRTGVFIGSVLYASPEQFSGKKPDGRSDLFSLGVLLYELSTGAHPHPGDSFAQVLGNVLDGETRPPGQRNPQLSPFLEEVIGCLLDKKPDRRFASARVLLEVLERGEESSWWIGRANAIRESTRRPLRRIRIPRETAVYGRGEELSKLRALYEEAKAGEGRVVLIEGEAGIGKTRLVDELVGQLQEDGEDLNFLFGSYAPGGAATAAGAWSTAYREHFGAETLEETLKEVLTVTPVLIPAFAALLRGEPPPPGEEALTKDSIQTVFVHATRALAKERTTIVLIEDLHFAPQEGLALLAAMALAVPGHRILLVGSARWGLPDEWRADLDRMDQTTRLGLLRLGPKDLANLLIDAFQSPRLAEELALRIGQKSDGNPFFVFEIIRGLRERQFLKRRPDGTWVTTQVIEDLEIPSTVQDLIQARLADLDDGEQEVLDVAACCGFDFDPLLVGRVLGQPDIPLLRLLGKIERTRRLARSVGTRYVFDHHQVQEALYENLSVLLRERYHAAIGEVLEDREGAAGKDPADLAGAVAVDLCEHLLLGAQGDRATRYLDAALEHLERGYLGDQAIRLARRALEEPDLLEGSRRVEVLLRLVAPLRLLGRIEAFGEVVDEALTLARAVGDRTLLWRAHEARGLYRATRSSYAEAEEAFERQLSVAREIGDRRGEGRALSNLGNMSAQTGRYAEALEHYDRWIAIARELGDRRGESATVRNLGIVLQRLGRPEEARERFEHGLEMARELGDRMGQASATEGLGHQSLSQGLHEEARGRFRASLAIYREIGDREGEASATGNLGVLSFDLGRYAEAREHFDHLLPIAREIGDRDTEATALSNLGNMLSLLGDEPGARRVLERALAIFREIGVRVLEGHTLLYLGEAAERSGDEEEAERRYTEALSICRDIEFAHGVAMVRNALGGLLISSGHVEEGREALEEAQAIGRQLGSPNTVVLAACRMALLPEADPAPALSAFEEQEAGLGHYEKLEARALLYQATGETEHLEEAHRLLCAVRDHAPAESRDTMLAAVPLHRDIMAAWSARGGE